MSLITRNNYEAYLLDYVEENLSPELIAELMLFLENNPDLRENLDDFEIHELLPELTNFLDKNELKREEGFINSSNYEDFIITEIEGGNTMEISSALQIYLRANPNKEKDFLLYQKTKLEGSPIIFKDKKSIKKKSGIVIPMNWWYSSAAAVAIIVFLFNGFEDSEKKYFPIAEREKAALLIGKVEGNVIADKVIIETKEITITEKKEVKQLKKAIEPTFIENKEKEKLNELASLSKEKEETSLTEEPKPQSENPNEEEILYAENSVKITYEEESLDNGTPRPVKRKMTKLDLVRAVIKHRVNGNLTKGKEKALIAFNAKPFSFLKKRNKN